MTKIREYTIIVVIAVLVAILIFSLSDAIVSISIDKPQYPDSCIESKAQNNKLDNVYRPIAINNNCSEAAVPTADEIRSCPGSLEPDYTTSKCPVEYVCRCYEITDAYENQKDRLSFWIQVILGALTIIIGMLLPQRISVNEWIGGGLIIGGIISLFIATAVYWSGINTLLRPLVIALELAIVIWISYKRFKK